MFVLILTALGMLVSAFQSQQQLVLENLALRHQVAVLKRSGRKPKLGRADRLLWVLFRRW
jgi:hypothetical protein